MDSGENLIPEETPVIVPAFFVKLQKRVLLGVGIAVLSMLALTLASAIYAVRINNANIVASQQAICPVFVALDQVYVTSPPSTQAGKNFAALVHNVVVKYHCSRKNLP